MLNNAITYHVHYNMSGFLFTITEFDILQLPFEPILRHTTVDRVTVYADECLSKSVRNIGCGGR